MSALDSLRLTAKLITLVAPFMAKADIRYYLNGINVRPHPDGGVLISATNGHALAIVYDKDGHCAEEVTLSLHPRTLAACAIRPYALKRLLVARGGRLAVLEAEHSQDEVCIQPGNPVIDNSIPYPDIFRVVPAEDSLVRGMAGSFTHHVMGLLMQASKAASNLTYPAGRFVSQPITFWTKDGDINLNAYARMEGFADFLCVMMPCRADEVKTPVPSWMNTARKADEVARAAKQAAKKAEAETAAKAKAEATAPA